MPSILIVEDETIVAADLANKLRRLGYAVADEVARGEDAVALARRQPPDLVLMDIRLAGAMDGVAAAEEIRRECDRPVVFLTAHSDAATLERAKLAEPFGYIVKPFEERELQTTIEMALYKHQTERHVREQREWFRVTLASIGDAVIACDERTRVAFLNPVAESLTGWATKDALGQPVARVVRLVGELTRQPCDDPVGGALREACRVDVPSGAALLTQDDRAIPIEGRAAPILDAASRAIGAVLVFQDVTERRRVDEALRFAAEQRRLALEAGHVGTWDYDFVAGTVFWDETCRTIFGVSSGEELEYPKVIGIMHAEDRDRVDHAVRAALRPDSNGIYEAEYRVVHPDGTQRWVAATGQAFFQGEGKERKAARFIGTARDVTESKEHQEALQRAHDQLELRVEQRTRELRETVSRLEAEMAARSRTEAELRESEERYRTLFASAPVGILVDNAAGRVHDANAALCEMLGLTLAEIRVLNAVTLYVKPSDRRQLVRRARQGGVREDFETVLQRQDGARFPAALRVNQIQTRHGKVLLTIVTDLTRRKRAEHHIQGVAALHELFLTKSSRAEYLEALVELLRHWCGCACAGVRLVDREGRLPYVAAVGYSRAFLNEEQRLCLHDAPFRCPRAQRAACVLQDAPRAAIDGAVPPVERRAPAGPSGGFPCVKAGFASVAQAPIRCRGHVIGTLQVADRAEGKFLPETLEFLNSAASLVGEALNRFQLEAELRESEMRFRSLFERHQAVMLLVEPDSGVIVNANKAAEEFYGHPRARLCTMSIQELSVRPHAAAPRPSPRTVHGLGARVIQTHRLANGQMRTVEIHASPITVQKRTLLFSILHDITERRRLEREVLEIGDRERQRIGRDLHDSLGGGLSGLAMLSKALAQTLRPRSGKEAALAEEIVAGINEAVRRTRTIARGLSPVGLSAFGFVNGLEELARNVEKRHEVRCCVRAPQDVMFQEDFVASHLFQIAEEAVNNAVRHGNARHIEITLARRRDCLSLSIRDDGIGMPKDVARSPGMGLRTMRYRADVLGATFEIQVPPKGGTVVSCVLPAMNATRPEVTPNPPQP